MGSRVVTVGLSKPRRRARDKAVVRRYWLMWQGLPCEYGLLHGESCRGEELNHILSGQSKEDAAWNFFVMCAFHHRDNVHGFHGLRGRLMREEILLAKLEQGFQLPREAYRYLSQGIDAAPVGTVDDEANFEVVRRRADELGELWS